MQAKRLPSRRMVALLACAAVLGAAFTSSASASITGYNEPAYTKTSANNAFWYQWQAFTGTNGSNNTSNYTYYLCANTYRNGVQVEAHNGTAGPGSTNCTNSLRSGPTPSSGNFSFLPFTAQTVLDDGARYTMCANGYYFDFFIWAQDNANFGNCPTTIIDRNAPAISASVNGEDVYTKNPVLALRIGYEDATSPPWFGSNGRASNWTCVTRDVACTPGGQPDADCSIPNVNNSRINSFNCQADVSSIGDGKWFFCARSADAAMPDNPAGTNQLGGTSNQANLSGVACGSVTLDRVGPAVTANASATTVTVGQLVSFGASASDPAGVSGQFDWDFGDNTGHGNGAATTHTYTQAGTYQVKASINDGAGNTGVGTRTIVVNPAPSGGGTTPGGGGTTPGGGGTTPGGGGTTPGGGGTTPGTSTGTSGAIPTQQPVTTTTVSQMAGGGGAQTQVIGGLGVIAPRSLKIGKAKALLLALTPESAGKAEVALLKGSKIVAKKGATFGAAGTYSLKVKLPKKLKTGNYSLKVSFTATGASKAVTKSLKVKVSAVKKAASRRKAVALEGIGGVAKAQKPRPQDRHIKVIR
jgi:plastocyanin